MSPEMRVGFAGLGRMGTEMARNLARAGHDLLLWNRSAAKALELAAELDCGTATTPRELATACDVVITMLADDEASARVHWGDDGLFAGAGTLTLVEMGTMSPDHVTALAGKAPHGVQVIDAPVSGSTQAARDASLMIMAGCSPAQASPLMPLFEAMGRRTICLGRPGAGAVMKLAVNAMIHGINQTLAEAMTLAGAAGIDAPTAFDVIEASAACAPMLKYRRPLYLEEAAHDVTFTVALARKDMAVMAALADTLGVAMPQGAVTLAKLREAEARGYADRDMASILQFMREENQ